jgi:hypothetical protein
VAILRTFRCGDCKTEFDTFDVDPDCPTCSKATQWVPKGGHILGQATKTQDAVMRDLATEHGLSDIQTQQREGDQAVKLSPTQQRMLDMADTFNKGGGVQTQLGGHDLGPRDYRENNFTVLKNASKGIRRPVDMASTVMSAPEAKP